MLIWQKGPSGGLLGISGETVFTFGGLWPPNVSQKGEWYRFITPVFLHFSVLHLGFNCMVIWILGRVAEIMYDPAKLLTLYMACGIVASATSYAWHVNDPAISAGASGAAFGLFGLVGVFAFKRGLDDLKRTVIQWVLINLVFGFTMSNIDMAAHLGGLVAGTAFAMLVKDAPMTRLSARAVRTWDLGAVMCIVAILVAFGFAFVGGGIIGGG